MEQEQSAYITSVHLKGYKSIRDVSVTLNKGLNILIGANGSGKTNFLEFLDAAYRNHVIKLLNGKSFEIKIEGFPVSLYTVGERSYNKDKKGIVYKVENSISFGKERNVSTTYFNEDRLLMSIEPDINNPFFLNTYDYNTYFLRFDNPLVSILKEKFTVNLLISTVDIPVGEDDSMESEIFRTKLKVNNDSYTFLNRIFNTESFDRDEIMSNFIDKIVKNQFFSVDSLNQNLKQFSPIKEIKIDSSLARQTILDDEFDQVEAALIEGIDFQFYVNNEWVNWSQLSDGTKRLFYLIGSVTYATENEIILIEEPELGVHPYQLSLLMNFLKSQSRDKQIIISTHSPQVLNCLGEDELDRIIVARHEGKAGTKLYHLSEEEKGYASGYMKNEAFLSDYWMLSGFMNEETVNAL